jgi:two-component system LytT family response regulator
MRTIIEAVIVDDDPLNLALLKAQISNNFNDIEIIGTAEGVKTGQELIERTNPDLVFLDILMPDGTGFDLLENLINTDFQVIFTTANDQFALKAFEFSAVDYLVKPISVDDLKKSINKFKKVKSIDNISDKLQVLRDNFSTPNKKLILPTMSGMKIVNVDDIIRFEASDSYSYVFLKNEKNPFLVSKGLKTFEELLTTSCFARVHNKHLINLRYVIEYMRGKGGSVRMIDNKEVEVASRKKNEFLCSLSKVALNLKTVE